jgi:D-amino-acid dehydrogenase
VKRVVVIGAGVVGVCCAFVLRREGYAVTLIDRDLPGMQCSLGNAGNLGGNAHFPSAAWLLKIPRMLLDPREPLSIIWNDLPTLLPWFIRYLAQSRPSRTREIAAAAASLNEGLHGSFVDMLREAGATDLLRWEGRLFAYRSEAALTEDRPSIELKCQAGVEIQVLTGNETRELEPSLSGLVECALYAPNAGHVINPFRFVQMLANSFQSHNGRLLRAEVRSFGIDTNGVQEVVTSEGSLKADAFVIAAGIGSSGLARQLQTRIPLVAERGYHAMLGDPGVSMRIPTMWVDRKVAVTPMENGIRVSGISEFGSPESKPNFKKVEMLISAAHELLPGLKTAHRESWMGCRPATPDYLPVIGRSLPYRNVVFACGHGHSGVMFGPITARLVADILSDRKPPVNLAPFSAARFH